MRRARLALAVLPFVVSCVIPPAEISPYGRSTQVVPRSGQWVSGELLASHSDSIWLLSQGTVHVLGLSNVAHLTVERHNFDFQHTMAWGSLYGLGTGVALAFA